MAVKGKQIIVDDGADSTAIHDNIAAEMSAVAEKTGPIDADLVLIEDSADSNNKKKVQVGNLPINTHLMWARYA